MADETISLDYYAPRFRVEIDGETIPRTGS